MSSAFMKIDGVSGESGDLAHPGEIEVLNWEWAVERKYDARSGSWDNTDSTTIADLNFTHRIDRASPNLLICALRGQHIPTAKLTVRRADGARPEHLTIALYNVKVTHIELAAGGNIALEHARLSFTRLRLEYTVQNVPGSSQGAVTSIFDVDKKQTI